MAEWAGGSGELGGRGLGIVATSRVNYDPVMTPSLVDAGVLDGADFLLVDVGASGGIDALWQAFHPRLHAVGFDPLIAEVARLNAAAPPGIRYIDLRRLPPLGGALPARAPR